MIVLNVTYRCKPGMRDEFLQKIQAEGIDAASRAEAGNLKYDYYVPAPAGTNCSCSRSGKTAPRSPCTANSRIFCVSDS